jgi:hypothetical protein
MSAEELLISHTYLASSDAPAAQVGIPAGWHRRFEQKGTVGILPNCHVICSTPFDSFSFEPAIAANPAPYLPGQTIR